MIRHLATTVHICPVCNKQIYRGVRMLIVNKQRYHPECFKCKECKKSISEYCILANQYYCTSCADEIQNPVTPRRRGTAEVKSVQFHRLLLKMIELAAKSRKLLEDATREILKMIDLATNAKDGTQLFECGKRASALKTVLMSYAVP
jgi:hypothetical protein